MSRLVPLRRRGPWSAEERQSEDAVRKGWGGSRLGWVRVEVDVGDVEDVVFGIRAELHLTRSQQLMRSGSIFCYDDFVQLRGFCLEHRGTRPATLGCRRRLLGSHMRRGRQSREAEEVKATSWSRDLCQTWFFLLVD